MSGGNATTSTRPSREAKPKSNLQNQFISAACNVKRWGAQAASLSVSAASRNEFYLLTLIRYNYAHSSHPYKMPIAAIIENGKITKSGEKKKRLCQKWGLPQFFWRICRLLSVFPRHTVTATVINLLVT